MKRKSLYALIALAVTGAGMGTAQAVDYGNWYIAPRLGVLVPDSKRDTQNSVLGGLVSASGLPRISRWTWSTH